MLLPGVPQSRLRCLGWRFAFGMLFFPVERPRLYFGYVGFRGFGGSGADRSFVPVVFAGISS